MASQLVKKLEAPLQALLVQLSPAMVRNVPPEIVSSAEAKRAEASLLQTQLQTCISEPEKSDCDPSSKKEVVRTH